MGRRSSGPMGFNTLGIGMTVALFHSVGKVHISIEVLIILSSKSCRARNRSFHIRVAIMGVPLNLKSCISFIFAIRSWRVSNYLTFP